MTWSDFFWGAVASLVASFVFAGIAILAYWLWLIPRRRDIRKFFGITRQTELNVYISSLWADTVFDIQPTDWNFPRLPRLSYFNNAVAAPEMREAYALQFLFQDVFRKLLNRFKGLGHFQLADVQIRVEPSPSEQQFSGRKEGSFIAMGGPSFSGAAKFIQNNLNPIVRFRITSGLPYLTVEGVGDYRGDGGLGFLERIVDQETGCTIFHAAGLGTPGTCCPVYFLRQNWRKLYRQYGLKKNFYIVFQTESDYSKFQILSQTTYPHPIWKQMLLSWFRRVLDKLEL